MSMAKRPSRETPVERPTTPIQQGLQRTERDQNSLTYRENVDRVNRAREIEIERALSSIRR